MADLEHNKQTVIAFITRAFNDKQPADAVAQYVGSQYIQHDPQSPDGAEAFIQFVNGFAGQFPQLRIDIKRVVAEGDLVVAHLLITMAPENRGMAGMDIFRLQEGKIVEHWDVLQPVPEQAANDNTMF
ncbi:MAG TPA: nuclear transport factor 2 family protein [Roseiflexaceae bacterium]|nr:nuclear transport factor 2 family protein [Roseiflexaceae bacterium]